MASEAHWSRYRTDSGVHAVYWIAEWPSVPVEAAWSYPLLALGGVRRTVSVTAQPIAPVPLAARGAQPAGGQAGRRGPAPTTGPGRDRPGRRGGRRPRTPRARAGPRPHRVPLHRLGDRQRRDATRTLEAACAQVEQAAVRSALEVRRVYGEVDQAFLVGGLPLNEGVTHEAHATSPVSPRRGRHRPSPAADARPRRTARRPATSRRSTRSSSTPASARAGVYVGRQAGSDA